MRYALYFTPPHDDPLTRAAARWLGRDAFDGMVHPAVAAGTMTSAEVAYHTAAARRYGFHATLKAPFMLAEGETEASLVAALDAFAARAEPVILPRIVLRRLSGFFALVPEQRSEALDLFAGEVVAGFERFRAPLTETDLLRRNPDGLTPAELKNLQQWGYPYVFDEFRFHMTLTGRVDAAESDKVARTLEGFFGPLLDEPLEIAAIALFVEPEPGAPFTVRSFHTIGQMPARKSA